MMHSNRIIFAKKKMGENREKKRKKMVKLEKTSMLFKVTGYTRVIWGCVSVLETKQNDKELTKVCA